MRGARAGQGRARKWLTCTTLAASCFPHICVSVSSSSRITSAIRASRCAVGVFASRICSHSGSTRFTSALRSRGAEGGGLVPADARRARAAALRALAGAAAASTEEGMDAAAASSSARFTPLLTTTARLLLPFGALSLAAPPATLPPLAGSKIECLVCLGLSLAPFSAFLASATGPLRPNLWSRFSSRSLPITVTAGLACAVDADGRVAGRYFLKCSSSARPHHNDVDVHPRSTLFQEVGHHLDTSEPESNAFSSIWPTARPEGKPLTKPGLSYRAGWCPHGIGCWPTCRLYRTHASA